MQCSEASAPVKGLRKRPIKAIRLTWRTEVTEEFDATLTVAEVAEILGLSTREVCKRARAGTLGEVWDPDDGLPDLEESPDYISTDERYFESIVPLVRRRRVAG